MVAFLNTSKAYATIEEIIDKATTNVVLISPYIRVSEQLFDRLKHKDRQGIGITVVCRGKDLDAEEKGKFRQLKHLELRFDEDLHAKCFYNEKTMVITSLNLYDYSVQHNREMGLLLSSDEDSDTFQEALREADFIVKGAEKGSTIKSIFSGIVKEAKSAIDSSFPEEPKRTRTQGRAKPAGYCIRCGKNIAYDSKAPYCPDCYSVWAKYKDPDYEEKFCHMCGTPNESASMNKPVCISCFRKSKR